MENELEYDLAYGAQVNETGRGPGSFYPPECSNPLVGPSACKFPGGYIPGNWLYPSDSADLVAHLFGMQAHAIDLATVSLDHEMGLADTFNAGKTEVNLINRAAPLTLGPGIFQKPYGAWAWMATTSGLRSGNFPRILVPPKSIHNLGLRILKNHAPPYAFRMDMLGDLIVDCGHVPFRTEIHPPVAIMLHLAGTEPTRYSLWGWHRSNVDRSSISVDIWPSVPRPSATAAIKMKVVFNGGIGSGQGKWQCGPAPSDVPTHIQCELAAAGANARGYCKDNRRMRPDCASDVAGGLVEVYWQ